MVAKKRSRRSRVLYDRLKKVEDRQDCTLWSGDKGLYVFERIDQVGQGRPVRRVYLNRQYFTGLFKTRDSKEYSGDIKSIDDKRYLVFKLVDKDQIDIFERR
jgi:hypothetical protein